MLCATFYTANTVYYGEKKDIQKTEDLLDDNNLAVKKIGDRYVFAAYPGEQEQTIMYSLAASINLANSDF